MADNLCLLVLPNPFPNAAPLASPRKLKRSRSPEEFIASAGEAGDDGKLSLHLAIIIEDNALLKLFPYDFVASFEVDER